MTYDLAFVARVLAVFDQYDQRDDLYWRCGAKWGGGEYHSPASFFVNCSDVFYWGCADGEEITPDNIAMLEQAMADCEAVDKVAGTCSAAWLFAARVRQMRPQGASYPGEAALWALFDACGPERAVGLGNPRPHPGVKAVEA